MQTIPILNLSKLVILWLFTWGWKFRANSLFDFLIKSGCCRFSLDTSVTSADQSSNNLFSNSPMLTRNFSYLSLSLFALSDLVKLRTNYIWVILIFPINCHVLLTEFQARKSHQLVPRSWGATCGSTSKCRPPPASFCPAALPIIFSLFAQ